MTLKALENAGAFFIGYPFIIQTKTVFKTIAATYKIEIRHSIGKGASIISA